MKSMLTQLEKIVTPPSKRANPAPARDEVLKCLGLERMNAGVFCGDWIGAGSVIDSVSPIDGQVLGRIKCGNSGDHGAAVQRAGEAFQTWQSIPAPKRGEIIRQFGNAL